MDEKEVPIEICDQFTNKNIFTDQPSWNQLIKDNDGNP